MKTDTRFWNRIANKYAAKPVADPDAYEYKLELTRQYLSPSNTVLELGCGTGTTALKQAGYVKSILATDFSEEMIAIAERKRDDASIENVSFKCKSISDFDRVENSYNVIMAHSLLHLLPELEGALATIYKNIEPGGYFVSSTSCILNMVPLFRFVAPIAYRLKLIPYLNCFDEAFLVESIRQAGFEICENWKPHKKASLFIVAKKPKTHV